MNSASIDDLYERYEANKDRPAWVRRHWDEIEAALDDAGFDLDEDIPQTLAAVDDWLDRYKAVLTQALAPSADETETADGSDSTGGEKS